MEFIVNIHPLRKFDPPRYSDLKLQNLENPIEGDPTTWHLRFQSQTSSP